MKKLIYLTLLGLLSLTCKKENLTQKNEWQKLGTNSTNSFLGFRQSYLLIEQTLKQKGKIPDELIPNEFYSLLQFEKQHSGLEIGQLMDNYLGLILGSGRRVNINTSDTPISKSKTDSLVYSALISELIEDEALKYLINDQGEVNVGDTLYKISPLGVFFAPIRYEAALRKTYAQLVALNDLAARMVKANAPLNFGGLTLNRSDKAEVYTIDFHVQFIDTFKDSNPSFLVMPEVEDGGGGGGGGGYNPPPENEDPFSDMQTIPIDFDSFFGSVWETIFTNHTKYRKFDSKHRISVLFYDRNYGLLKTLGLKVKFQKKGWFWWNKTETDDMIAGWDNIVYKQKNAFPSFSRPANELPVTFSPYYINPYEAPANGWFTTDKAGLYSWHYAKSDNELFAIMIPEFLVPPTFGNLNLKSSDLKPLIKSGWDEFKKILLKSVPMAPLGDPDTFKFPIHDIKTGQINYYTITEMDGMTKALPSTPDPFQQLIVGNQIHTFLGPLQVRRQNEDKIDFDLDFSTATLTLSLNPNSPLSIRTVLNSLSLSNLDDQYEVETADVYGTVKHGGKWLGIRLSVHAN